MTTTSRQQVRNRDAATDRSIEAACAAVKAENDAHFEAAKKAASERNTPILFTDEQYKAATLVRTKLGWFKVAKVSAKSVSVETGFSWTDRIARDKIIEVR